MGNFMRKASQTRTFSRGRPTPIRLTSILGGRKSVDLLRGLYVNIMTFTTQLKESIKRQDRDIQLKGPRPTADF